MALITKAAKWEKVYIFISSTFNDMHAERDYLVKNVFPELGEWCDRRKLRMVDIDLRWGVTEADATQNRNVVHVCLNRIDECRPFFLCFIGQRYGWVPERKEISDETFERFPGLEETVNRGASVTELEVLHSMISPFHSKNTMEAKGYHPSEYSFFYLRDESYFQELPSEPRYLKRIYSDREEEDGERREELQRKREELIRKIEDTRRPRHLYKACWAEDQKTPEIALALQCPATLEENQKRWREDWLKYAGVQVAGLDVKEDPQAASKAKAFNEQVTRGRLTSFECDGRELGNTVLEELKRAIAERFPEHRERKDPDELQKEIDQQEHFVFINSEGFIRRSGDFDELDAYVNDGSNQLFVLTAEGGMGKTALLANWVDRKKREVRDKPGQSVYFRFIGASDGSMTVSSLLRWLLREIRDIDGKLDEEIPDDPQELRRALPDLLEKIGQKGKTVIVLDALNQLETGLSDLAWLPRRLPEGIKLIVSFKRGEKAAEDLYDRLARDQAVRLAEVKPFEDLEDRRKLIKAYLSQFLKELDERHLEALAETEGTRNPLYLKVVLSELRVFGAFASLGEKIRSDFGTTPLTAFSSVLDRLERDPAYSPLDPREAVPLLFGFLAQARHGLSVKELTSLFLQALNMEDCKESRTPVSETIHLFLRQVRPFLARRDGRYDFFYESFKNAALNRYVSEEDRPPKRTERTWHKMLADYFYALPMWKERESEKEASLRLRKIPDHRRAAELPHHLTRAEDWDRLERTLCDLRFIEAKCAAGMTYDLIADYNRAFDNWPEAREEKNGEREYEERRRKYAQDLVAFARHDIQELEIIPSVGPQSADRANGDIEGMTGNSTALKRLRAFFRFMRENSHALLKFASYPGFCVHQAYNSALSGPVVYAAEALAEKEENEILLFHHPSRRPFNPQNALQRTFEGHLKQVHCVSITPDGGTGVSASDDETLRFWDLAGVGLLRTLEGHGSKITCVSITPDGRRAVSGSWDRTVRVWDLQSGECLAALQGHTRHIQSVSISADGRRALSSGDDATLRLWDLEKGECLVTLGPRPLEGNTGSVYGVSVTPDGKRAVAVTDERTLHLWDLERGERLARLEGHTDEIRCARISSDGKRAVSGSNDQTLRLWDLERGEPLAVLEGHSDYVLCVDITADGKRAVSGGGDKILKVWDLDSGKCSATLQGHTHSIRGVGVSADGKRAVSGSSDRTLRIWELESGECLRILQAHTDEVNSVRVTPDGRLAVSGSDDLTVRVWDLDSGDCLRRLEGHTESVRTVAVSANGEWAVSGGIDESVRVWNLNTGELQTVLEGNGSLVFSVDITPDGKRVVSGCSDGTVWVRDLDNARFPGTLKGHTYPVQSVSMTPDSRRAVSGGSDKDLRVWDLERAECLAVLKGHSNAIWNVNITPDGRRAVSGGRDGILRVWDLESGTCLAALEAKSSISCVNITADGKRAVLGSGDSLQLWDIESGRRVGDFQGHTASLLSVSITPDGMKALTGSSDKTVRLWDLRGRGRSGLIDRHRSEVTGLGIIPGGRGVLSVSGDSSVGIWSLKTGGLYGFLDGDGGGIQRVKLTADGSRAVTAGSIFLQVWDLDMGICLHNLDEGRIADPARGLDISRDGRRAVAGSRYHTLRIWDLKSGECLRTLEGHFGRVDCIRMTPDGARIVSGSDDKTLRVWDTESGTCLLTLSGHTGPIDELDITPDGATAVSASSDQTLRVWDLESGACRKTLEGHTQRVALVSIAPDGKKAVSGSSDGTLRLWDLRTGECLRTLRGHGSFVLCLSLAPDGGTVVSGGADNTLRVWDLASGHCLAVYQAGSWVTAVSEVGAKDILAFGTQQGDVVLLTPRNLAIGAPLITAYRVRSYSPYGGYPRDEVKAICPLCLRSFIPDSGVLDGIVRIAKDADLPAGRSPCLELPHEVWDNPSLAAACPQCHNPLQFNPFVMDSRS